LIAAVDEFLISMKANSRSQKGIQRSINRATAPIADKAEKFESDPEARLQAIRITHTAIVIQDKRVIIAFLSVELEKRRTVSTALHEHFAVP
jgi:hypothetical protein